MTAFRLLAERIAEDIEGREWYFCNNLVEPYLDYIIDWFKPNLDEIKLYSMGHNAWMCEDDLTTLQNNQFRILILLFAEQHYKHYKKIDEK